MPKKKPKKTKQLTPAKREEIRGKAHAAVDAALAPPKKRKGRWDFPGGPELAIGVGELRLRLHRAVQGIYEQALTQAMAKLRHAKRKQIV